MQNDKKTIVISKRSHLTKPPQVVARNQNMWIKMEKTNWQNKWIGNMAMGKCEYWQRKFYIDQKNCKHSKRGYGRLPFGDVYTCNGFLPRMGKFEKTNSKTFLYKLIERFVDRVFGNP